MRVLGRGECSVRSKSGPEQATQRAWCPLTSVGQDGGEEKRWAFLKCCPPILAAWPQHGGHLPCQVLTLTKASVGSRVTQFWGQGESRPVPGLQRPGQRCQDQAQSPILLMPSEQGARTRHGKERGYPPVLSRHIPFKLSPSKTIPVWEKGLQSDTAHLPHLHLHPSSQAIWTPQT